MIIVSSSYNQADQITDGVIFENREYYLLIENPNSNELASYLIGKNTFSQHVSWIPGNSVATLKIKNHIGKIRILDDEFDVRSLKFLSGLPGTEQLNFIIADLDKMSKQATFTYQSSIYLDTKTDWEELQADLIHQFNILYNAFFNIAKEKRVDELFRIIKLNPAREIQPIATKVWPWELRQVGPKEVLALTKSGGLSQNKYSTLSNKVNVTSRELLLDTIENRFVYYFFRYCEQICLRLLSIKDNQKPKSFDWLKVDHLLKAVHRSLSDDFFDNINISPTITPASNILLQRSGYKELFRLFNQSLFALKSVFEWEHDLHTSELNDIATIYEVWCFYKVSTEILGESIFVDEKKSYLENGKLRYSVIFSDDNYEISFNKTYSRAAGTSYSSQLRPDISILCKANNDIHHMDAKYKISEYESQDTTLSTFKAEDINKMHAYLDAISDSKSSIVLYPGNEFKFYQKSESSGNSTISSIRQSFTLDGVGALPLSPGSENKDFVYFMQTFFQN